MLDSLKIFLPVLERVWEIVKIWWWLPMPFILWWPFSFLWLWWRADKFSSESPYLLLEIKIPKEVLKPIRAMEVVLDGLWQIAYDEAGTIYEKWVEGKSSLAYSFEIVSIEGEPHFYIQIPKANIDAIEGSIYAQYPNAEISIVDDYIKKIPQDIPNQEWDLWGADYKLLKPSPYPIKTYLEFESEREALEEKRIDPIATLLEVMAKIEKGEQLWVQIVATPVTNKEVPWVEEGEAIRDELSKRNPKKAKQRSILGEATEVLLTGNIPEDKKEEVKEILPPEMKLTMGERDIVSAIERKMAKRGFETNIRFIYLGQKDVFFKPKLRLALAYFSNFGTQNFNNLVPHGQPYITKIQKSMIPLLNIGFKRREYLRKRKIYRNYVNRVQPNYPASPKYPSSFILNTEEVASIYHFPGRESASAPFMQRIETKKGEAPMDLPME
ncbi:hypothetical protein KKA24_00825 [Patescibacteria group bacterium]|nr:hypothetical protein [Patescibacteria group bacterium]